MKTTGTKEAGTGLWTTPNEGATNSSGFTGLPGGYRFTDMWYSAWSIYGYFWTSCAGGWYRYLVFNDTPLYRATYDTSAGFSVRCVRN